MPQAQLAPTVPEVQQAKLVFQDSVETKEPVEIRVLLPKAPQVKPVHPAQLDDLVATACAERLDEPVDQV